MKDNLRTNKSAPDIRVEEVTNELSQTDLNDLCDATDAAIEDGGGFGWLELPSREILEKYWKGVITIPNRILFVARLDGVICGTAQLVCPTRNNEAQSFTVKLTTNFVAPWARSHGLARLLLKYTEKTALEEGYSVINLDVRETQKAATSLYEGCGYKVFGSHPFYAKVDGKVIPGLYYYKVINPDLKEKVI